MFFILFSSHRTKLVSRLSLFLLVILCLCICSINILETRINCVNGFCVKSIERSRYRYNMHTKYHEVGRRSSPPPQQSVRRITFCLAVGVGGTLLRHSSIEYWNLPGILFPDIFPVKRSCNLLILQK